MTRCLFELACHAIREVGRQLDSGVVLAQDPDQAGEQHGVKRALGRWLSRDFVRCLDRPAGKQVQASRRRSGNDGARAQPVRATAKPGAVPVAIRLGGQLRAREKVEARPVQHHATEGRQNTQRCGVGSPSRRARRVGGMGKPDAAPHVSV